MRQPRGLGAIAVAMALVAGCEDPVTVVSTLSSPSPASSPNASPAATTSPGATPSGGATATPTPAPTSVVVTTPTPFNPTPSPSLFVSPSPTATPRVVASSAIALSVTLDQPTDSASLGPNKVDIIAHASPGTGITLSNMQVYYDGNLLFDQKSSATALTVKNWDPNVVNNVSTDAGASNASPVPWGNHTLSARALTTTNVSVESPILSFFKQLLFRGWVTKTTDSRQAALPPLPSARAGVKLYATQGYLFAFFGTGPAGVAANSVLSLGLNLAKPVWTPHAAPNLTWRQDLALAGQDSHVYLVGGQPLMPGSTTATDVPGKKVDAFDVFDHVTTALPDLPIAITRASAVVMDNYLYVIGGSTTAAVVDASKRVFRLYLNSDGLPSTSAVWEERTALPAPLAGASACVGGGALFLLGGQAPDGSRREGIQTYDVSGNSWSRTQVLPTAVSDGTAVDLAQSLYYIGGFVNGGTATSNVFRFDYTDAAHGFPVKAFSASPPNLPDLRARAGITVLRDDQAGDHIFVVGGEKGGLPLADLLMADTL